FEWAGEPQAYSQCICAGVRLTPEKGSLCFIMKANDKTSVATFSDLEKAEEVKRRLDAAGIPCGIVDGLKLQNFWFVSKSLAGEKVVIHEKDFDRAMQALHVADEQDHVLQGEVRCPEC